MHTEATEMETSLHANKNNGLIFHNFRPS